MMKKLLYLTILFVVCCLSATAQVPYEFLPSEWTTSDGGRVSASEFTPDDAAKTLHINASGTNNTCFMLSNDYSGKYFITSDKNYFVVKGDKLDIGAGCSYVWWFNGFNQGAQTSPSYSVETSDGNMFIIWRIDNNAAINGYMDYTTDTILISNNGMQLINAIGLTSLGSTGSTLYDVNFYSMKEIVAINPLLADPLGYSATALQTLMDKAQRLYDNSTAAASLQGAISRANTALSGSSDDVCDAVDTLTKALAAFEQWYQLLDLIEKGAAELSQYSVEDFGSPEFLEALNVARQSLNSTDEAAIKAAIGTLQVAYTQFQLYHIPEEGIDMTSYVVNASFKDCDFSTNVDKVPDGWYIVIDSNGDTVRTAAETKNYFANWLGVNDYTSNPYRDDCGTHVFGIWTGAIPAFQFSQTLTGLPEGSYSVKCWMAVGGGGGNRMVDQRLFANNAEQLYSEAGTNNPGDDGPYYQLAVDAFVANGTLTLGIRTGGGTTDGNGWYKVGNFTLTYYGLTAQFALGSLQETVSDYLNDNVNEMVPGIAYTLDDQLQNSYNFVGDFIEDEDALQAYKDLMTVYEQTQEAMKVTENISSLLGELEVLSEKNYSGKLALMMAINKASNYLTDEEATYEGLQELYTELCASRVAYIFSQSATSEAPAEVTEVILCPSFRAAGEDDIQEALRASDGWKTDNVGNGGDYTTYFNQGHTCWNSWSNNFTSMNVYQEISGLPAGIYSVKSIAITQAGCLNDQHAYIESDISTAVSPVMTIEGWDNNGSFVGGSGTLGDGQWEELATGKVKLGEGATLRIGFASTYNPSNTAANASNGWFCVTDFRLFYYGIQDDNLFDERVAEVNAEKENVLLSGDVACIDGWIEEAKSLKASDEVAAYALLKKALDYAHFSIAAYGDFMTDGYDKLLLSLTEEGYQGALEACEALQNKIEDVLNADGTIYTDLEQWNMLAKGYAGYASLCNEIQVNYLSSSEDYAEVYVQKLTDLMTVQTTAMKTSLLPEETLTAYRTQLGYALKDMQLSQVLTATDYVELSFMIENSSFEADGVEQVQVYDPPTGWSILIDDVDCPTAQDIKDSGLNGWCGCNKDADETKTGDFVFGIWNAVTPKFEISQKIENMPNGHYTVTVDMATPVSGILSRLGGQRLFLNDRESYFKDYVIDEVTGLGEYYEAETDRGPLQPISVEADVTDNTLYFGVRSDDSKAYADSLMSGSGVGWFKIDHFTLQGKDFTIPENWVIDTKVEELHSTAAQVCEQQFFLLDGTALKSPARGLNIVKTLYSDGTVKVSKVYVK